MNSNCPSENYKPLLNDFDNHLKTELFKLLPDIIWVSDTGIYYWNVSDTRVERMINDTELLHVCHLIESGKSPVLPLTNEEIKRVYVDYLVCEMNKGEFTVMAPWQKRARALIKMCADEIKKI